MTAAELAEKLTVIADQTKVLRDAGVVGRVNVADISFEIGEELAPASATPVATAPQNPIDDPDTYGGYIPQRRVIEPRPTAEAETDDDDD